MPAPALRLKEVTTALNLMLTGQTKPSELAVARAAKEINAIKREDFGQGFSLEGVLATIRHDRDAALTAFRKALQFSEDDSDHPAHHNYVVCLMAMGDLYSAIDHLRCIAKCQTSSKETAVLMARAGAVLEAEEVYCKHNHSTQSANFQFANTAKFMRGAGISDNDLVSALTTATEMVWNNGFLICGSGNFALDDGALVELIVPVYVSSDLLTEWEWELDRSLVSHNSPLISAGLSVSFNWADSDDATQVA